MPVSPLVLLLCSCATSAGDPFGARAPRSDRDRADTHRVRFEVSCDVCAINWRVALDSGSLADTAVWSHRTTVLVRPGAPTVAYLSATPMSGSIAWVRISVDGEVVAEAPERGAMEGKNFDPGGSLSVSTPIPPPAEGRGIGATLTPPAPPPRP